MHTDRKINGRTRLILRRTLYCGGGSVIVVALAFALDLIPLHCLRVQVWGVDLEGIVIRSLFSAGFCVSTVLALRRYRLIPLSVAASLLIGLVTHKIAKEFLWALYPSDNEVGLGEFGKFIDQHYSLMFGFDAGALIGDFFAVPLAALFCSALSRNIRALVGGSGTGLVMSLITLLLSFWFTEVTMFASKTDLFIALALSIPQIFISGAILGGSMALGEYLAVHLPSRRRGRESSSAVTKT